MVIRGLPLLVLAACAGEPLLEGVRVTDARAPAPPDAAVAAVYFSISNGGPADTLVSVTTDVAARASVHRSTVVDGRRAMESVAALAVPTGASIELAPGGLHVMLEDLGTAPMAGDTIVLTLTFRRAGAVRVPVPVVHYEDLVW